MDRRGFSLIELLVVVSIMGLTLGVSAGYYIHFRAGNALGLGSQAIVAAMHQARSLAITEQVSHGVALDVDRSVVFVFRRPDQTTRTPVSEDYALPDRVAIDSTNFTADGVLGVPVTVFSETGTTINGSIWLRNNSGAFNTITVVGPTGRCRTYNYYRTS